MKLITHSPFFDSLLAPVSTEPARTSDSKSLGRNFKPARKVPAPSPHFVGRQAELAQLHKWLERALEGDRQIVFVTGEPGIGKTTLVEEFLRQEGGFREKTLWVGRGQCIEHYGTGEAYLPVLDALGRLCREPGGARLVKLLDEYAPSWLVQMPSLVAADRRPALHEKAADATHARMLRELADALEVITAETPVILRFEDLHWSDYSTLEWLGLLARRQESARLLVLGTYRPVEVILREHPLKDLKQELQIHGQCKELPLALLKESVVAEYVNLRFGSPLDAVNVQGRGDFCPQEPLRKLAHKIYQRTDGNPLFMVNVVDYLVESGPIMNARQIDVPPTIQQMIVRNLERLDPKDQRILEVASVAGSVFSAAAIAAALQQPLVDVETHCSGLARREQFIQAKDAINWPDGSVAASFRFEHALYQQVIYGRIPAGQRAEFHGRIAQCEERGYGERTAQIANELAHHYRNANNKNKAIHYLSVAGEQAIRRSAHADAVGSLSSAIELLDSLPDDAERIRREVPLQIMLGGALMPSKGYASAEVKSVYATAYELCKHSREALQVPALLGLWVYYYVRGEQLSVARELAEQCLALARTLQDPALLLEAHLPFGATLFHLGDFEQANIHFEQGLSLYDPRIHRNHAFVYGQDPGMAGSVYASLLLWHAGFPDRALKKLNDALNLANELRHPFTSAFALVFAAWLHQARGDASESRRHSEAAIAVCAQHGFPQWSGMARILRGWGLAEQGQTNEGIDQIRQGWEAYETTGAGLIRPYFLTLLAEACRRGKRMKEGRAALTEAQASIRNNGECSYEEEAQRLQAEFLVADGAGAELEAERQLRSAIASARIRNARSLELKATTSLARLLRDSNRRDEARKMLAEVYCWFTEGFDTADLKNAKALLNELTA